MRASNCAHTESAPRPGRVAPATSRSGFGRGALLPAVSFGPACAAAYHCESSSIRYRCCRSFPDSRRYSVRETSRVGSMCSNSVNMVR